MILKKIFAISAFVFLGSASNCIDDKSVWNYKYLWENANGKALLIYEDDHVLPIAEIDLSLRPDEILTSEEEMRKKLCILNVKKIQSGLDDIFNNKEKLYQQTLVCPRDYERLKYIMQNIEKLNDKQKHGIKNLRTSVFNFALFNNLAQLLNNIDSKIVNKDISNELFDLYLKLAGEISAEISKYYKILNDKSSSDTTESTIEN